MIFWDPFSGNYCPYPSEKRMNLSNLAHLPCLKYLWEQPWCGDKMTVQPNRRDLLCPRNGIKPTRSSTLHTKVIRWKYRVKFRIMSGCTIMSDGSYDLIQTVQMPELQAFDIDRKGRFHQRDRNGIMRRLRQECLCHWRSSVEGVNKKWGALNDPIHGRPTFPYFLEVRIWIMIMKKEIKMKIQTTMKTWDASWGEALGQNECMGFRYRLKIWGNFILKGSKIWSFPDKTADLSSLIINVSLLWCLPLKAITECVRGVTFHPLFYYFQKNHINCDNNCSNK